MDVDPVPLPGHAYVATFALLTPVFVLLFGVALLGEPLTLQLALALVGVVAGIVLVNPQRPPA